MAYIGKAPNTAIVNQTTSQSFNGTGSATAFTLNRSVNVSEDLEVFVNNVQQEPGSGKAYTASGTTLTFSAAPASGTGNIYVIYRGEATINPRLEHDANSALAATTGTFTGAFTSPGIDDNAGATAVIIDSNNVFMTGGKTSASFDNIGFQISPSATAGFTKDGATALYVNRKSSDGTIIEARKDNTTVGSIGIQSSGFYIDGESGHEGIRFANGAITPRENGSDSDGTSDLGASNNRFKDLYLGGNLYLGGTGSANALSDYEEGTFTPAYTEGLTSVSYQFRGGKYTKVGRLVYFQISIRASAATTNGNQVRISGLPFNSDTSAAAYGGAFITYNNNWYVQLGGPTLFIQENDTHVLFYKKSDGGTLKGNDSDLQELNDIHINGFYMT